MIDEENLFCFAGFVELEQTFNPAVGLGHNFFMLAPELQKNMINAWIDSLEYCLTEGFLESLSNETEVGEMAVMVSSQYIEVKSIPDNVVPFRRKDEQRE